jgi:hypothetical protein
MLQPLAFWEALQSVDCSLFKCKIQVHVRTVEYQRNGGLTALLFLTSALFGGEWLVSRAGNFTPWIMSAVR